VFIAKEMGWTIEYVLNMGITQYNAVRDSIKYLYDELGKASSQFEARFFR